MIESEFDVKMYREIINQKSDSRFRHHIQNRQDWCDKSHNIRRNAQLLSKDIDLRQNGADCCKILKQSLRNIRMLSINSLSAIN